MHPTAIIDPKAKLADSVAIGPYSCIGPDVVIGEGTQVYNGVTITGRTTIGKNCRIFNNASIGSPPQDLKYNGEDTELIIGDNNIIREFVTINTGTIVTGKTELGSNCLLMAYSHIAHDCKVGNNVVLANAGTLGGHVIIEDNVVIGGLVGVHQFVRVGSYTIIGACSKAVKDLAPFAAYEGSRARFYGINSIGLKRAGFKTKQINNISQAYRILFRSGLNKTSALARMKKELGSSPEVKKIIEFINSSKRGISRA